MSTERRCAQSGLLVDGDTRLATDPCEYFRWGDGVQVGCGRLWCANCQAWVRGGPPGLGLKADARVDLRALHAAPDWSALAFVEEPYALHNRMRLYACTCRSWAAESVEPIDNDREFASDPDVPWACAGHPVPALPLALGELRIDGDTDWAKLVDTILRGSCPRALERQDALGAEPALWLTWLYVYLRGLPVADDLSAAIAQRHQDADPQVVGRVLYFFSQVPRANDVAQLVARAEADVHRVALGYPIPEATSAVTLWSVIVARLVSAPSQRDELDTRVASLINRLLFVPLTSLPHDDLGPTGTVDFERQRRARQGWDDDTLTWFLTDFARTRARERADVIGHALATSSSIFADPELRVFIADHVVELDAAAPGRWRAVMTLLSDWLHKPAQGHLLVVAGARVIESGLATPDELRAWIDERRAYGWVRDEWVVPLESILTQR
jgi:hypothetical protein